jgi:hypothetical protein
VVIADKTAPQQHRVQVPQPLRDKVLAVQQALAEQGLGVEEQYGIVVKGEPNRYDNYLFYNRDTANHVWLVFTVLKEVIVNWPKIRRPRFQPLREIVDSLFRD